MIAGFSQRKASGVHYTPARLASFVAERLVDRFNPVPGTPLRIIDPACGDGALLEALRDSLRHSWYGPVVVYGVETDPTAALAAEQRLSGWKEAEVHIVRGDFLELCAHEGGQGQLWKPEEPDARFLRAFDLAIANPPYVRTQILGSCTSQRLGERFGLSGRVDLYHVFWVALTESLRLGGMLGIITSNRFLSTLGASSLRRFLQRNYNIEEIIDLGDSKLFEAAVLPAVFVGRRITAESVRPANRVGNFLRLYSCDEPVDGDKSQPPTTDVLRILRRGRPGRYRTTGGSFELARGNLKTESGAGTVWSLTTASEDDWLTRVRRASSGILGDLAQVRVGVKSTADEVFIRSDWEALPEDQRPEPELLHSLLSHENARRWLSKSSQRKERTILYPHRIINGERRPIELADFPRAGAYLESNRERLERRKYVLDAGRRWYEIWVPQSPDAWKQAKVVCPDISPEPKFYVDTSGKIIDGDSYWMTLHHHVDGNWLYVLMALANSSVMARYHDLAFNNRLYSGRRRYITQYVSQYPVPRMSASISHELVTLTKSIVALRSTGADSLTVIKQEFELNRIVASAFGVEEVD